MLPWANIDTVLLDMDGTLLDLHFDNHFWLDVIPYQLSLQRGISLGAAKVVVERAYEQVAGTLEWYCLDYWQQQLGLDILTLHQTITERIQIRQDSMPFLRALKQANKQRILITNAHPKNLALKLAHTHIDHELDSVLSSHQVGAPKEHPDFWQGLLQRYPIDPARCLFIDDNEIILMAAKKAGIAHQLGISNPDSQQPHSIFTDFPAISDYHLLLDDLHHSAT